jgi:hypothetical protein
MPNCEKAHQVHDQSQAIGEFIEWLQDEKGILLAQWEKGRVAVQRLMPAHKDIQRLLAEFFDIDYDEMQQEKDRLLEYVRQRAGYG